MDECEWLFVLIIPVCLCNRLSVPHLSSNDSCGVSENPAVTPHSQMVTLQIPISVRNHPINILWSFDHYNLYSGMVLGLALQLQNKYQ